MKKHDLWENIEPVIIEIDVNNGVFKPREEIVITIRLPEGLRIYLELSHAVEVKMINSEILKKPLSGNLDFRFQVILPGTYLIVLKDIMLAESGDKARTDFLLKFKRKKIFFNNKPIKLGEFKVKW